MQRLTVAQLSPNPTNRLQGELAAETLQEVIQNGPVFLDCDDPPHIIESPTSPDSTFGRLNLTDLRTTQDFFEALVKESSRMGLLNRITFETRNPRVKHSIAITAAFLMERVTVNQPD